MPPPSWLRLGSVASLSGVVVLLALDRGQLVALACAVAILDVVLDVGRASSWGRRALAIRYAALGPFALAVLALAGAPGEAVVLAATWLLQCVVALGTTRAAVPLLAGAALLALAPRPQPVRGGLGLRVATYNLEWGKAGSRPLAATIRGLDADVYALQEVVDGRHWRHVELFHELLRETGLHGVAAVEPHPTHGSFGIGILSRYELVSPQSLALPLVPRSGASRLAIKAKVRVGGRLVTVVSAHLDRPPHASIAQNLAQTEAVLAWIRDDDPVVLCGDFNAFPVYPSHRRLVAELTPLRGVQRWPSGTWPAPLGLIRLDWIFVRGLSPLSLRVVRTGPSDHFPVVADLAFPAPTVYSSTAR